MLLEFASSPRIGFASTVYGPSTYHDQDEDTAVMRRVFGHLEGLALAPERSRDLLITMLRET